MKKKNYIQPSMAIHETLCSSPMALSGNHITNNGDVTFNGADDEADADEGCSRRGSVFDDFYQVLLVLIMMTATLGANAQNYTTIEPAAPPVDGKTHAMRIQLKTSVEISYDADQLSHVTYLPGIGMKVYLKNATTSVDYLFSQMERIEYVMDVVNDNANAKAFSMTDFPEAYRLEYPRLNSNVSATGSVDNCQVIVKRTEDYGITYSLEWDNAKIANRWTCYELHAGNSLSSVDRHDDFKSDPEVIVSATLNDYKNSGFSRGHLCPSADRLCSTEQNKQTFFLTNMQPQYQSHNGGLWSRLETQVRDYATNDSYTESHCDTLYIVKAATITDKVTIGDEELDGVYPDIKCGKEGTRDHELLVPKYFYMALLHYNKATDTYHALAFWTEHIDANQSVANLGDYAITIDELERRTGLDFFCNLPDTVEDEVESTVDWDFWHLTPKELLYYALSTMNYSSPSIIR